MKIRMLILAALLAGAGFSQDITAIISYQNSVLLTQGTVFLNLTGPDGTTCVATKVPGKVINAALQCNSGATSLKTTVLQAAGAQSNMPWGYGSVLCLFIVNPTSTAIAPFGSWTAIPAVGIGWQCATSGQGPLNAGAVGWP